MTRGNAQGKVCVRLPEQTDDDGAGEQRDERQTVAQSRQNLHSPVEDQLDTKAQKSGGVRASVKDDNHLMRSSVGLLSF